MTIKSNLKLNRQQQSILRRNDNIAHLLKNYSELFYSFTQGCSPDAKAIQYLGFNLPQLRSNLHNVCSKIKSLQKKIKKFSDSSRLQNPELNQE